MAKPKIDVLNLQAFSFSSRDREQATLVCNYLRYMGYNVLERSSWRGFINIRKHKPKVLFLANISGAKSYIKLADYCKQAGIKVLSGDTEGNVKKESVNRAFWGHYKEKEIIEDIHMLWSQRIKDIIAKSNPNLTPKLKVGGAPGFDLYKISTFISKKEFLTHHKKNNYKKVIGFGCWDFGPFFKDDLRHSIIKKEYDNNIISRFKKDREELNQILRKIIVNNPDILFILKEHPFCQLGHFASGIQNCEKHDNTLILKNEPIIDCISASDIWVSYESTTSLEAWLLKKPTCLINPSGIDFPRANIHWGSPNYPTLTEFQNAIDLFYQQNTLPRFSDLKSKRNSILKETIQWDDGLNHVRIGNEIISLLDQTKHGTFNVKFSPLIYLKTRAIEYLAPLFKQKFKYVHLAQKKFKNKDVEKFGIKRMAEQKAFYKNNNLTKEELRKINAI